VLVVLLAALFGVAYAGSGSWWRLTTRNVQATNTQLPALLPSAVPDAELRPVRPLSPVMETLAKITR